jgi:vacuolar protein-sorting-associated protein 4
LADITSKFIGESEKLLNILFELAREEAPSIILIDEMDSLGRTRTGNESETERRIKTEFLKQMDKIRTIPEKVSVFATTNMPWELDIAALRRFERKILVPMPDFKARAKILELHSGIQHRLTQQDYLDLAKITDGYSGSDLSTLVNDGLMRPIKEIGVATHFRKVPKQHLIEIGEMTDTDNESDTPSVNEILESGEASKHKGYAWMPVIVDQNNPDYDPELAKQNDIKELDMV